MEGERHDTKRQGEADGERSAEEAMVEGRDTHTAHARAPGLALCMPWGSCR